MQTGKIKILVVDKRELFAEGLARVLANKPGIEVVGICLRGSEAIQKARQVHPDIVIIDTELPDGECIETTRSISTLLPKAKVFVLTHSEADEDLFSAFKVGARGYVTKDVRVNELVTAINIVAEGGIIISPQMAEKMLGELSSTKVAEGKKLTGQEIGLSQREKEVLNLLAKGASNKVIADTLFIAENTVKVHLRNLMEKLHVHSRLHAALLSQEGKTESHTD